MKKISEVVTANLSKSQSANANVETKLLPPYLRYSVPAERAQIEARIRAVKRKRLLSGPTMEADSKIIDGLVVGSNASGPGFDGTSISASANPVVKGRNIETLSPGQPTTRSGAIQTRTGKKVTASASIIPDGVVSLGWYCPTEFRVNCATGQTGTDYIWSLECGQERFHLGENNDGKLYFLLDGQTYGLGAQASNGSLPVKVICDITSHSDPPHSIELPVTLNFINQSPCISLLSASFPDEQDPCELVGDDHGQRPKIRVNLTAPAGPSGQTVFLIMDDPHNPLVGRWASAGIDSFVIPFGQTSGEWERFLGTRKVLSTKTISIRARVNQQESQPLEIKVKKN